MRMQDCKEELHGLLQEDVRILELDQVVVDFVILLGTATGRRITPRFCQQARHPRFDD
jgi:hypothetical protein